MYIAIEEKFWKIIYDYKFHCMLGISVEVTNYGNERVYNLKIVLLEKLKNILWMTFNK